MASVWCHRVAFFWLVANVLCNRVAFFDAWIQPNACFHIYGPVEEYNLFPDVAVLGFHIHHHHHHHHHHNHHHLPRGIWLQEFCYKHFDGYPVVAG